MPGIVVIALRSGTNADHAVKQLRLTAQDAANVAGGSAGRTPLRVLEQYVAWAENAERMLANVLEVEYLDDLVHTPRYWVLRTARGAEARLTPSVLAEIERQRRQLDALAAELEAERQRWADDPATIVVPDTNMFLQEGAPIEGIDWPASVESEVAVRLVVPLVVVHELDRLKRQGNNTVRSSARCALKWLLVHLPKDPRGRSAALTQGTPSTTVEVYVHAGPSRPEDADGVIIDVTGWLATLSTMHVKLVTRDLGMLLRAAATGVDALKLPDAEP